MFRNLENHLFIGFVQPFFVGEDEVGDAMLAIAVRDFVGAVEDDVEGFGMDAHNHIGGITGEMMQKVINMIH